MIILKPVERRHAAEESDDGVSAVRFCNHAIDCLIARFDGSCWGRFVIDTHTDQVVFWVTDALRCGLRNKTVLITCYEDGIGVWSCIDGL